MPSQSLFNGTEKRTEKGKTMFKFVVFVLFVMIGNELKMGEWYWWTLCAYAFCGLLARLWGGCNERKAD